LADFEVAILGSVLPYLYFKKFVCEDRIRKVNYFGHLKIVTTYQQYLAYQRKLNMKNYDDEEEREMYEKEVANKYSDIEGIFSENSHLFSRTNYVKAPITPVLDNHFS
jgi:hypothetical protein